MLIRYAVDNYKSFGDVGGFSMIPSNRLKKLKHHITPARSSNEFDVLRGAIIYGANASGKSNFVESLAFLKKLIAHPVKPKKKNPTHPFRMGREKDASTFEIEFISNGYSYRYLLAIDSNSISKEELYLINPNSQQIIYTRMLGIDSSKESYWGERFEGNDSDSKSRLSYFLDECPSNRTLLSEFRERGISSDFAGQEHLQNVIDWFLYSLQIIRPGRRYKLLISDLRSSEKKLKFYSKILEVMDTGISDLKLVEIDEADVPEDILSHLSEIIAEEVESSSGQIIVSTKDGDFIFEIEEDQVVKVQVTKSVHETTKGSYQFDLKEESDGTRRIIDLAPAFYNAAVGNSEKVYVIDELDRSLHPLISRAMLDLFFSKHLHPSGQVITTTHESSLLDSTLLRRDSIWFVQKEDDQVSSLYSLSDYKSVRSDKDIRKAYLAGVFGGIPHDCEKIKELTHYLKELARELTE
jgi:AAA15 family ATPase/GTPase